MLVIEEQMLTILDASNRIILLEPPYKHDYIPLGLAKISTYLKDRNKEVVYQRVYEPFDEDLICVTTCFTYDIDKVYKELDSILAFNPDANILMGGVLASLMHKKILKDYPTLKLFIGCSSILDDCLPDFTIDYQVPEKWTQFSMLASTRGCPNHCAYCCTNTLEPEHYIVKNWKNHILLDKKYVMLSDNNISSFPVEHLREIIEYCNEHKKKIYFNCGIDCKYVNEEVAEILGSAKYIYSGFRTAFDRIEEDGQFQTAMKLLIKYGLAPSSITVFSLFNFDDKPKDADYRNRECVKLKIRPYPTVFRPLNMLDKKKKYKGKHWTPKLVTGFRNFWLFAGNFKKDTFENFLNLRNTSVYSEDEIQSNVADTFGKVRFTQEDVDQYYKY